MTTLLFVHGTGVREARCAQFTEVLRKGLAKASPEPGIRVESCYWGDLGAVLPERPLSLPGPGGPDRTPAQDEADEADEEEIERWQILYAHPEAEFEVTGAYPAPAPTADRADGDAPGGPLWQQVRARIEELPQDTQIQALLSADPVPDPAAPAEFARAAAAIAGSPAVDLAMRRTASVGGTETRMLARALVAAFFQRMRARAVDEADPPEAGAQLQPLSAEQRDELVARIVVLLGAEDLGVRSALLTTWLKANAWAMAPWLRRNRARITDAAGPATGDIILYQARGERIRERLREAILASDGPCVVLGHSLGGIIAVDLLIEDAQAADRVPLLLTAGSQAPYLYEINALSALPAGARLPGHFPRRWLNFWDPRDLLSYLAADVFADREGGAGRHIEDVRINTRQPFHWSHSAYFQHSGFVDRVARELGECAQPGARR
jgi:hypothetical protein